METALIIIHLIFALALIVIVLLQHGKQEGLSGAIAGGAETFFGKNKGRTVDAMLKKVTSVVAILFIVTSLALAYVGSKKGDASDTTGAAQTQTEENTTLTQEQLEELISQQAENADGAQEEADGTEAAESETEAGNRESAADAGDGENTADAQ